MYCTPHELNSGFGEAADHYQWRVTCSSLKQGSCLGAVIFLLRLSWQPFGSEPVSSSSRYSLRGMANRQGEVEVEEGRMQATRRVNAGHSAGYIRGRLGTLSSIICDFVAQSWYRDNFSRILALALALTPLHNHCVIALSFVFVATI